MAEREHLTPDDEALVPRWEYKLVKMGNPLEPDVEERANAFGSQAWELVAIDAGVWVFKRQLRDIAEETNPLLAIVEQTIPLVEAEQPAP